MTMAIKNTFAANTALNLLLHVSPNKNLLPSQQNSLNNFLDERDVLTVNVCFLSNVLYKIPMSLFIANSTHGRSRSGEISQ